MTHSTLKELPLKVPAAERSDTLPVKIQQESIVVLYDSEIYSPEVIDLEPSLIAQEDVKVLAEIGFPQDNDEDLLAAIISSRDVSGKIVFTLLGLDSTEAGPVANGRSVKISSEGSGSQFGRSEDCISADQLWQNKKFDKHVSRNHISITQHGNALLVEDTSTNGTAVRSRAAYERKLQEGLDDEGNVAVHTSKAHDKARQVGLLEENDQVKQFAGRPTIGRDTFPIDGHVDIRGWVGGGEAIVIDSKRESTKAVYDKFRQSALRILHSPAHRIKNIKRTPEEQVLSAIYEATVRGMKYDADYADKEEARMAKKSSAHRKIDLSSYLTSGKGVCRHMALAEVWLGGEMVEAGLLSGTMTADVNQSRDSAHEWARYVDQNGKVYILDPAQKYFGTLEGSLKEKRLGKSKWDYFRPGERAKYLVGRHVVGNS